MNGANKGKLFLIVGAAMTDVFNLLKSRGFFTYHQV